MLNFLKKSSNKQTDSHRLSSFSGVTKPVTGVEGWRGGGEEWKGEGGERIISFYYIIIFVCTHKLSI